MNALAKLGELYSLNDCERFPASQMSEGLERARTLYWADFSVADAFGLKAVKETFENANFETLGFKEITELVVALNHKVWEWYGKAEAAIDAVRKAYCQKRYATYLSLYQKVDYWAKENLTGDEARFFYAVID